MSTSKSSGIQLEQGLHLSDEELIEHALKLSKKTGSIRDRLLHWDFGPIMHMKYQTTAANYLFSNEDVPLHWDGAFFQEPRRLLFYCVESNGLGGETLFSNTELLWESLSQSERTECLRVRLCYQTEKKAHYGGEINVPLVQKHPDTGKTILRLAEEVETKLNPVKLEITGVSDPEGFYQTMREKLYRPDFLIEHAWRAGDLLVCDNFTYLHGRRPLGANLGRSFKRVQIL